MSVIPEELVQRCTEAFFNKEPVPPEAAAMQPGPKGLLAALIRLRNPMEVKPLAEWFGISRATVTYGRMILVHGNEDDIRGAWTGAWGQSGPSVVQRIRARQRNEGTRTERPTRFLVFKQIRDALEGIGHCPSPFETARIAIDVSRGSMDIDRIRRAAAWLKEFEDEYRKLSSNDEAA